MPKHQISITMLAFVGILIVLILVSAGCSSDNPSNNNTQPSAQTSSNVTQSAATKLPPTRTLVPHTPTPVPPSPTPTLRAFDPDVRVQLKSSTALLYQPDSNPVSPREIPAGTEVVLFGKDDKGQWYRVLWSDMVGWVPAQIVDFPATKATLLRAPPPCSKGLAVTQGLGAEWASTYSGDVAIVVDLYRASFGKDYPPSKLQIRVNGNIVPGKERAISTRGKRLLSGAVIPVALKKGQRVSPVLQTSSQEPLQQFVTYFSAPAGCAFPQD